MTKMASAFNTTVAALEEELMQLILDGQINARIDSHNKVRSKSLSVNMVFKQVLMKTILTLSRNDFLFIYLCMFQNVLYIFSVMFFLLDC